MIGKEHSTATATATAMATVVVGVVVVVVVLIAVAVVAAVAAVAAVVKYCGGWRGRVSPAFLSCVLACCIVAPGLLMLGVSEFWRHVL